jgi:hypothetical protein
MIDDHEVIPEPGIGLALVAVFGIISTIAVLSVLIWALMVGVAATTAGRHEQAPASGQTVIDQKPLPAKQPPAPAKP